MDVKYINPFVVAIKNVFKTMIDVPFTLGSPTLKKDRTPSFDISSIIGLSGNVSGCVVINLSTPVALQLVSALLGDEVTEVDEDTIDAIGEIANMIAGNAKTDFPGENNAISVPTVVTGKHDVAYPSGIPIIAIPCETEAGQMVVEVAIKAKE
jgi:chemotaxis protein CheX